MSRKRRIDHEIADLLEQFENEENECCDSASDDETDNDFEVNELDESEQSDCEIGISGGGGDDEEDNTKYIGKDGYEWSKKSKCNRRTPRSNIITSMHLID